MPFDRLREELRAWLVGIPGDCGPVLCYDYETDLHLFRFLLGRALRADRAVRGPTPEGARTSGCGGGARLWRIRRHAVALGARSVPEGAHGATASRLGTRAPACAGSTAGITRRKGGCYGSRLNCSPGGRESGKRVIALADYAVVLDDAVLGEVGERAIVRSYPRWATSVWDLVARGLAAALNRGREGLPPRPAKPEVTVRVNDAGFRYVRPDEIPEPARTFFDQAFSGSGIPDHDCAYAHDWSDFLGGQR